MDEQLPGSAYTFLREKISCGELPPGSWLKEQEIAAQLGISRTPVREALARLELEGFVKSSPRRGAVVCQLELDEIDEIYEIRAALEHLVAKRACQRATEAEIDAMEQELCAAERCVDLEDFAAARPHTAEFHILLNRSSRSPRLIAMLHSLDARLAVYRNRTRHTPERAEVVRRQHRGILEGLRARNVAEMQRWIDDHAERGRLSAINTHLEEARMRRMDGYAAPAAIQPEGKAE